MSMSSRLTDNILPLFFLLLTFSAVSISVFGVSASSCLPVCVCVIYVHVRAELKSTEYNKPYTYSLTERHHTFICQPSGRMSSVKKYEYRSTRQRRRLLLLLYKQHTKRDSCYICSLQESRVQCSTYMRVGHTVTVGFYRFLFCFVFANSSYSLLRHIYFFLN